MDPKLEQVVGACVETRQIFEIPQPKIEITEHRVEEKLCPCCGKHTRGTFPGNVRGPVQMDEASILRNLKGIGIHDHWFPYFSYAQMSHGLCNAHHLRELTFIHEEKKEEWAKQMKDLLIFANQEVEKHAKQGSLPSDVMLGIKKTYGKIVDALSDAIRGAPRLLSGKSQVELSIAA